MSSQCVTPPRASRLQLLLGQTIIPLGIFTPLIAPLLWHYSPALALGTMAASHFPYFYGTLAPNRKIFGPVATHFEPEGNEVWLTIDDGPTPNDTSRMLDLLDAADARATFFVRGDRALACPQLIAEILRRGHNLGNHTYSHPQTSFWRLPPWRIKSEIEDCNQVLRELTGQAPRWFRAPVGMINPYVHGVTQASGMRVVGWSARGLDAGKSCPEPATVVERILRNLRPGGIALLHEGRIGHSEDDAPNVRALEMLLAALTERGWRAVIPEDVRLR